MRTRSVRTFGVAKRLPLPAAAFALAALAAVSAGSVGAQDREERPLGWGGPVEAPEVRKWSKEMLAAAPLWTVGDRPLFVFVLDSVNRSSDTLNWTEKRRVHEAGVVWDGVLVLDYGASGGDSDAVLFHIVDPASGKEVKVPVPRGRDGRGMDVCRGVWTGGMDVRGGEISLLLRPAGGEGDARTFAMNRDGVVRETGMVARCGSHVGAFSDGSLVYFKGAGASGAYVRQAVRAARPVSAGDSAVKPDTGTVLFFAAHVRDTTEQRYPIPIHGAHLAETMTVVAGDTLWIVPTERPELVAVGRSGQALLRVEWEEAGRDRVPGSAPTFPAAAEIKAGPDRRIYVRRRTVPGARAEPGNRWLVFEADGALVARLETPPAWSVLAFGPGTVVVQTRDERRRLGDVHVYALGARG